MVGKIYISGLIGNLPLEKGIELIDVISQIKKQPEATSFEVYIKSQGGCVETGFQIYEYLKKLPQQVTTIGQGIVASIATVVFMSGDVRKCEPETKFMIHLPEGDYGEGGTADELEAFAKKVREVENNMLSFYSEVMSLPKETIKPLLKNETWLTNEQTKDLGITTVPLQITAYYKSKITMSDKNTLSKEDKNWLQETIKTIVGAFKPKVTNLMVFDANGNEINFPDLEEGRDVTVGQKATVNEETANGEYQMPSGETYVFENGELSEIKEGEPESDEEFEALKKENEELKEQVEQLTASKKDSDTKLAETEKQITGLKKETEEKLAQITSKFDLDLKGNPKKPENETSRKLLKD